MDPLTQALMLANTVAQIILISLQHQTPEQWAKTAEMRTKQLDMVLGIVEHFKPKTAEVK